MDIKIDSGLTDYIDHKFIDELQFQVNQMLVNEVEESRIAATSIGEIQLVKKENIIYVKKQDN